MCSTPKVCRIHRDIHIRSSTNPPFILATEELHHAVNLSKPQLIFVDQLRKDIVDTVTQRNPFIKSVVQFGPEYDRYIAAHLDTEQPFVSAAQQTNENVCFIYCSSGTTGLSKGVELTQHNVMVAMQQQMERPQGEETKHAPVSINLGTLTWYHGMGCLSVLAKLIKRQLVVFLHAFDELLFLQSISVRYSNRARQHPK